ncbi:MAG: lytic transglycosylase domain-containing protein [Thermoanaerobaculia bacterium]
MNRAVPTVIAPILSRIRQLGRGSNTFCVGAFALSLVNLAAGQQPMQQPAAPAAPPALLAAAPAPHPAPAPAPVAPPAATPAQTAKPAPAETVKPAATAEAPKEAPKPVPAVPKAETPAPAPAPTPAPAATRPQTPPAPDPNDEVERLKRAADLLVKVNAALGTPQSPYGKVIYDIAVRHSINPHLVAALIHVESAFNPKAVSPKGAYGLMQLLPETARRFGLTRKKDLFDPKKNLEAGVRYLKWLADRFGGDAEKILAAYNAGEGAVQRFGGIPPYQETQSYVQKIFGLLGVAFTPAPAPAPVTAPSSQESVAAR